MPAFSAVVSLNDGWLFRAPDSEEWTSVNLPHTWNETPMLSRTICAVKECTAVN